MIDDPIAPGQADDRVVGPFRHPSPYGGTSVRVGVSPSLPRQSLGFLARIALNAQITVTEIEPASRTAFSLDPSILPMVR
jgi:hypothetical protein